MLRKLNSLLNIIIGCSIGVFIGYSIYVYWDYKTHPDLYMATSFPWYTGIQIYGMAAALIVILAVIVKLILRRKIQ